MTSVIATAPSTDDSIQASRLRAAGSTPAIRAPSGSAAAARRARPKRVRRKKAVRAAPAAAATSRVATALRATEKSPSENDGPAHGGGRTLAPEPHTALTPARRAAEQPRRTTSAGMMCSRRPRVTKSQASPRAAAAATDTASAGHQPSPEPNRPPGVIRSPWRTAATVPMATTATLGTRVA